MPRLTSISGKSAAVSVCAGADETKANAAKALMMVAKGSDVWFMMFFQHYVGNIPI